MLLEPTVGGAATRGTLVSHTPNAEAVRTPTMNSVVVVYIGVDILLIVRNKDMLNRREWQIIL